MNLLGKGVPNALIGSEGDYYIDTLTSFAYGPKTGDSWGEKMPLASILDNLAEFAPDQSEPAPTPDSTNVIELTPIQKLEDKIDELEADGSELYAAAIDVLKFERDKLIADAEAKAAQVQNNVQGAIEDVEGGAKEVEQAAKSFWQKHGRSITDGVKVFFAAATTVELLILLIKH